MMEKTLILKHISRMLCLLISYSKFTRTLNIIYWINRRKRDIMKKNLHEKQVQKEKLRGLKYEYF